MQMIIRHPGQRRLPAVALSAMLSASAIAASAAPPQTPTAAMSDELLHAMQRDLGMAASSAARYPEIERAAVARDQQARRLLGASFAGSWIERDANGGFHAVIASTDGNALRHAQSLDAEIRVVARTLAQLETAKSRLDQAAKQRRPDARIHVWYVDPKTNQVVVEADLSARNAVSEFVGANGIDPNAARFEQSRGAPRPTQIVGGDRYNSTAGWCSIGFPVVRNGDPGFATAGHCGNAGTTTTGTNGVAQGVFANSNFPTNDMAWVRITNQPSWPLRPWVNNYAGGTIPIAGSQQAPVGAAICRSGARTGLRCGTVTANNVTVNYSVGAVFGLTSTSACVGFGDSGGAYITPAGQAQGVASGGQFESGTIDNCAMNPPISFHQPLAPLMNQYGLALFAAAPGGAAPSITSFRCPDYNSSGAGTYQCSMTYSSPTPAYIRWSGGNGEGYHYAGGSEYFGTCTRYQALSITVSVTNANGTVTRTGNFGCPMGPIP